jgi:DNA-binding beta-propeller fold protein YncE
MLRLLFIAAIFVVAPWHLNAGEVTLVVGGPEAKLVQPFACDFDRDGSLLFVEMVGGERLRRVKLDGTIETLAGTGKKGFQASETFVTEAMFNGMHALLVAKSGEVYLADTFNHVIRVYDPKSKTIKLFAGTGKPGFAGDGGALLEAQFTQTINIAFDPAQKTMYIADIGNRRVRAIDMATKSLRTVAGTGAKGQPQDGELAVNQPLTDPRAVAVDTKGNLYILERGGHRLYVVNPEGKIRAVAGTGKAGNSSGAALKSAMNGPKFLAMDRDDSVLIVDTENHQLCRYAPGKETLTAIAGTGKAGSGGLGGEALKLELKRPHGVLVEPKTGAYYIADSENGRVLKVLRARSVSE